MIARDQRALLRRIANIYPGPGGGMDPSPGGGGYSGPGGGKYIGPSHYAEGGSVPPFKLHSGAAKIIKSKGQAKATPQQYAAMPGVKPDELKHSKFDTLGSKALPREEVIKHLEDNAVPLQESVLRHHEGDYVPHDDVREDDGDSKYHEYQLPGGQNYREVLLHTPAMHTPSPELAKARARAEAATRAFDDELGEQLVNPDASEEDYRRASAEADAARIALARLERADKSAAASAGFRGGHWDQPNVVAHVRMSDRVGPNGEKILHLEEAQSDWGQQGRDQGFERDPDDLKRAEKARDDYVASLPARVRAELDRRIATARSEGREPSVEVAKQIAEDFDAKPRDAAQFLGETDKHNELLNNAMPSRTLNAKTPRGPYVDNTQKWTDLALKRVLHEAAHGGYDKIVVTPGDEQNKRYDLSSQVKNISYFPDIGYLNAETHDGRGIEENDVKPGDLSKHIGKEAADRILKQGLQRHEGRGRLGGEFYHELEGDGLKMGGAGMRGYYDNILPKRLQALAQQHDLQAKVNLHDSFQDAPTTVPNTSITRQRAPMTLHSLDVTPQMRDSIKQGGFNSFKRGGDVGMRQRYADGGGADSPFVSRALDLTSLAQPRSPIAQAQSTLRSLTTQPTEVGKTSVKSLSDAFDKSISAHLALKPADRIANSKRAADSLGAHIGRLQTGRPVPLLTKNAKLLKSETGYGDEAPVQLPDGRGVETTGLALAPAYEEGKFTTCPNSASCKAECLGKTSGNYFKVGGGKDLSAFKGPRLNSLKKTIGMLRDPESFAVRLNDEIESAKREAAMNGNHLGIRLNVLSDLNPRIHKAIIENHPDVTFYDYTKNNTNPIAPNHHYTYSSTGVSQDGVDNPHSNWKQMRKRLDTGSNVAMAFSDREHLPEMVHDEETGKHYKVVNGDKHDFRPLDIQPRGADGVIVGLKNKKATGTTANAHIDSKGFFVKYDPQLQKNAKGTYVRGESVGMRKDGKPMLGDTVPTNHIVTIKTQRAAPPVKTNDTGGEK